jgi:hypothetical protein
MSSMDSDQQLRQLMGRLEQNARWWPRIRWAQLVLSVALVLLSAYQFVTLEELSTQTSLAAMGIEQSKASELIDKVVEYRMRTIWRQIDIYFGGYLFGIVGLILLTNTLMTWRGKINETALLICLRNIGLSTDANDKGT